ncbi:MAG TPA: exodeoxyribonuclease VII large subunit [Terriglobales bacterium]|nr:exodeoxyribonuclease VII large subunit [Terriglobales bacterium]
MKAASGPVMVRRRAAPGSCQSADISALPLRYTAMNMAAEDQLGFNFRAIDRAAGRRIWTLRDLLASVRTQLEREYREAWVEGEISNFRAAESGHMYFTLKDESAQVRVVIFRSQAKLLRFKPGNGMQVIVRGRVTVYEDRGELQILGEYMEPKGAGALLIAFEQLKAKLEAEGLFEASRKKPIPAMPRRIGIVSSPQAAALRDVLKVLHQRHRTVNVLIYPSQVQGDAAPTEVSAGIRYFNRIRSVEVIIVARGGGSEEDLAAFNHEGLARTVASSTIPVISAIGHETDFTIIDFVADLRAPTPSAAAEMVILSRQQIEEQAFALHDRLQRAMRYRLLMGRQALTELAQHGAFARIMDLINQRQQKLDDIMFRMERAQRLIVERHRRRWQTAAAAVRHYDMRRVLAGIRQQLDAEAGKLAAAARNSLLARRGHWERLGSQLEALSPLAILERGYALVFDSSGRLVKDATQVNSGEEITARVSRGEITATVKNRKQ